MIPVCMYYEKYITLILIGLPVGKNILLAYFSSNERQKYWISFIDTGLLNFETFFVLFQSNIHMYNNQLINY